MNDVARPALRRSMRRVLVTGGCGFIGSHLADALAARNEHVVILDNLCRAGAEENCAWLKRRHRNHVTIEIADVRDEKAVEALVTISEAVLHLAAQVAVTTSLKQPKQDFAVNASGTLNVLEAVRRRNPRAAVIFASTNKVYGRLLTDDAMLLRGSRYVPRDERLADGVGEGAPLDLYSPYGCSKGAADQYVRDYARVFGLRTAVMRMSCIYGPRQFGNEDQGWIAHFLMQALRGRPVTIFGDGFQVRDALYVDDAVSAWLAALDRIDEVKGRVFNLGGGPANAVSLRELIDLMADMLPHRPQVTFGKWRPGDQPWYVSDIRAIGKAVGWFPRVSMQDGLPALHRWLVQRFAGSLPESRLLEAPA
jgi:CDP-paratose 2-epimerase